jgi:hypothetical protein
MWIDHVTSVEYVGRMQNSISLLKQLKLIGEWIVGSIETAFDKINQQSNSKKER